MMMIIITLGTDYDYPTRSTFTTNVHIIQLTKTSGGHVPWNSVKNIKQLPCVLVGLKMFHLARFQQIYLTKFIFSVSWIF